MSARGDFLVIGSGIAGLRAALSLAREGTVLVLTKAEPRESNTGYAQGGIAAAIGPDDSPELHARDTLAAGDGLAVAEAVEVLVREGVGYVLELVEWDTAFDRDTESRLALAREAAHSVRRVLHARDATGREIGRALWARVQATPGIRMLDGAMATDLLLDDGRCVGATFVDAQGMVREARAERTLLATGGAGHVYQETTNPAIATGDGVAMGARAGVRVSDLEFVQFHPTVLSVPGRPRFLLSEALRGEGARLVNEDGEAFMRRYEDAGDLAPRDQVARAILREVRRTGRPVYLTMAHLDPDFVRTRFPTITRACADAGLDAARDRLPVSPAAHYVMGGVETDLEARTSVAGLFAAGEVACTGVHGANRLASNSLLEGLVFGARAATAMVGPLRAPRFDTALTTWRLPAPAPGAVPALDEVQRLMWHDVGPLRDGDGLARAVVQLGRWWAALSAAGAPAPGDLSTRRLSSVLLVGLLMARAALRREESRGAHFRADFPVRDDLHWRRRVADELVRS